MSRVVAQFDPSAQSGQFQAMVVNRCSALLVMNESPNFLQLDFGGAGSRMIVQPWFNLVIRLTQPVQTVDWQVVASLQSGGAPASVVYVVGYEPSEHVNDALTGPLFRQSNVGNAASVASATSSVQNDGNAAGTSVVEATPTGGGSSQLLWRNDGSGVFGGGKGTVNNAGIFTLPASAIPVASLGSGALPAGVTVPAAQVGSGYPGGNVSGAVASATNASQLTTGAGQFTAIDDGTVVHVRVSGLSGGRTIRFEGWNGSTQTAGLDIRTDASIAFANAGSLTGIYLISGSGSATVNHGLTATPNAALVNTNNGSNSTTYGSGSYTSSTVYIYQFNAQPWTGLVYKS